FDSKGSPSDGQAVAKDVLDDTSLVAVVLNDPAAEGSIGQILGNTDLPIIGGGNGSTVSTWGKLPNYFPIATNQPAVAAMSVTAAAAGAHKSFGVLVCAENPTCASAGPLFERTATAKGLEYGGLQTISATAPDYNAECLKGDNVDVLNLAVVPTVVQRVAANCAQQGFKGWFGVSSGSAAQAD